MSDFHRRVAIHVAKLEGVAGVRFGRRFADHPHLSICLVNGVTFDYPMRGRPIDGCAGYFKSIVGAVRREVRSRLGDGAPTSATTTGSRRKRRRMRRWIPVPAPTPVDLGDIPNMTYCGPPAPSAESPFAVLGSLIIPTT